MSSLLQMRSVPGDVRQALKSLAAARSQSLNALCWS